MFLIFGFKYNPGLIASVLLNITFGIYAIYFIGPKLSFEANVYSIVFWHCCPSFYDDLWIWFFETSCKKNELKEEENELN